MRKKPASPNLGRQIIILIFILATVVVISGCGKKPLVNNQPENNTVVENQNEVATTTENIKEENITQDPQIIYINKLTNQKIKTDDWVKFLNNGYNFSFKYPKKWDYVVKIYINSNSISFYNEFGAYQMTINTNSNTDMNCSRNSIVDRSFFQITDIFYFKTNDIETDLLFNTISNSFKNKTYEQFAELSWEPSRKASEWNKDLCFNSAYENGRISFGFDKKEKEKRLAIFQEIINSFKFLSREEIDSIKNESMFAHQNKKIIKDVKNNPSLFFTNIEYLKLVDIKPSREMEGIDLGETDSASTSPASINNAIITFEGKAIVEGYYSYGDSYLGQEVCFTEPYKNNKAVMPRLKRENYINSDIGFCFDNKEDAKNYFKISSSTKEKTGEARIEINSYKEIIYPAGVISWATIKKVID